jgi:predicted MFS family arabinose efflux permease
MAASLLRAAATAYRQAYSGINRPVWLLASVSLINRAGTMVLPFLLLYLTTQKGFTTAAAGRALALYGAGGVAGSYLGGWLCDRLAPERVMVASLLLVGGGFLLLGRLEQHAAIETMIFVLSLVGEAFRPANSVAIAAASAPGRIAQSLALYRLAINLGMSVGQAAGGFLANYSYSWLFRIDGATSIAAAVLLLFSFRQAAAPARAPLVPAAGERIRNTTLLRDGSFLVLLALTLLMATVYMQTLGAWTLTLVDQYRFSKQQVGIMLSISTLGIVLFEMVLVRALAGHEPLRVIGLGCFLFAAGLALLPLGASFAFVVATTLLWTLGEMLCLPFLGAGFTGLARVRRLRAADR